LTTLTATENQLRDSNGRNYTLAAELEAATAKTNRLTSDVKELTETVNKLRSDLASEGHHTEEARSTAKDRMSAITREHERAVDKVELEWSEKLRTATQDRDRSFAEKRVLEDKFRESEDEMVRLRSEIHGTKLRMRFGETVGASSGSNMQRGNVDQPAPSPMFSDDMGPATPLVLDSIDSEPNPYLNNSQGGGGGSEAILAENERLRDTVGLMRSEMEELTNQLLDKSDAGEKGRAPPQSPAALQALETQLNHAREYVNLLQKSNSPTDELDLLRRHVQDMSANLDALR